MKDVLQKLYRISNIDRGWYTISMVNADKNVKSESFINSRFKQATTRFQNVLKNSRATPGSSFEIALLETNGQGWIVEDLEEIYPTIEQANIARFNLIAIYEEKSDMLYIGSHFNKGVYGSSETEYRFNVKFPSNVSKEKFYKYFDVIEKIVGFIENKIKTMAYLAYNQCGNVEYQIKDTMSLYYFVKDSMKASV